MTVVDSAHLEGAVRRMAVALVDRLGDEFVATARAGVSRRTGETYEKIGHDPALETATGATVHVYSHAESSRYQDEGTGIFGPDGARIVSRSGGPLRFDWPAAGGIVFAMSIAGMPGTHFWQDALDRWPDMVARI